MELEHAAAWKFTWRGPAESRCCQLPLDTTLALPLSDQVTLSPCLYQSYAHDSALSHHAVITTTKREHFHTKKKNFHQIYREFSDACFLGSSDARNHDTCGARHLNACQHADKFPYFPAEPLTSCCFFGRSKCRANSLHTLLHLTYKLFVVLLRLLCASRTPQH